MYSKKICIFIVLTCTFKRSFSVISDKQNDTLHVLRKPTNFEVYGRQNKYFQNIIPQAYYHRRQYPSYSKPYSYNHITHDPYIRPTPNLYYSDPYYEQPTNQGIRQNIMDVLNSITKNDNLQCVPKILCEFTSGTLSGRQYGQNLPININMESLIGLLPLLNGLQSSPLLYFGKAALLGYTSKGNSRTCTHQYPECPSEPDKLVQYLNNHNGGFFRYFNGINPKLYAPFHQGFNQNFQQPVPSYFNRQDVADKRIQNTPVKYISGNSIRQNKGFLFPEKDYLQFPENTDNYRSPKKINFYKENGPYFEKPLENHKASALIFPDRTGTGQLIVDSEYFNKDTRVPFKDEREYYTSNDISNVRNFYFSLNRLEHDRKLHFPDR